MTISLLQRPTLVLNRQWQPVHVAPLQRAIVLLAKGAARAVDPSDYQLYGWDDWLRLEPRSAEEAIQGVSLLVRAPEVVALCQFDGLPAARVAFSKRNVFKRDRYTCQYCGRQPGVEEVTLDHVQPRSQGGQTSWENCVLACLPCNRKKADQTPDQAGMRLRRRPERPSWRPLYAMASTQLESWSRFLGAGQGPLALVS